MPISKAPVAETPIDAVLVRSLLQEQHPDLAALPLTEAGAGWDNTLFRLGTDLVVRLPRRQLAAELVEHEHRWLPELASRLPLPVPAPTRVGRPALGYPWSWVVSRWLPGRTAAERLFDDERDAGTRLGHFLGALHHPAPADAPAHPFRSTLASRGQRSTPCWPIEQPETADNRPQASRTRGSTPPGRP
jgi:aminoglycoside phosphotransferase (APT) family kinase protein